MDSPGTRLGTPGRTRGPRKESRRTEARPHEGDCPYWDIYARSSIGVLRTRPDGTVLAVNEAGAKMFGFRSPAEMLSRVHHMAEVYVDPERRQELISLLQSEGSVEGFEVRARRADETWFWTEVHAYAVPDQHGNVVEIRGLFFD